MHPESLLAHAGYDGDSETSAVIPPIHLATTFAREAESSMPGEFFYSRASNPTRQAFESLMTRLEEGEQSFAFSSGMAASAAVFACLYPGARVILPSDMYFGVRKLANDHLARWGVVLDVVDMKDLDATAEAIHAGCDLVWIETPSNPMVDIVDIAAISRLARDAGAVSVVDGTWTTPLIQKPLDLGAHAVVHSATKYLSGHSDVLGGVVVVGHDFPWPDVLKSHQQTVGSVMDPFSAWLAMRGMRTLAIRLASQCHNAMALSAMLAATQGVERVHYPGLKTHAGHELAARQMRAFGGMLSFEVEGGRDRAMEVVRRCRLFKAATSLGGTESLIEHRASIEENSTTPEGLIRVSAGIEHSEDLLHDLARALGID
jgi:cystathionine gamma-synthase